MSDFCVYEHVFPNGKRYIGISNNPLKRWRNGEGYNTQPKVSRAINKYGWNHIQHNIIVEGLTQEQAKKLEMYLIASLNIIKSGYNQTIGGDNINSYYLDSEVVEKLKQIHSSFKNDEIENDGLIYLIEQGKSDSDVADLVNNAHKAVTMKHGVFTGDVRELAEWHWHMTQFILLNDKVMNGEDVSEWKEEMIEQYIYDCFFQDEKKGE